MDGNKCDFISQLRVRSLNLRLSIDSTTYSLAVLVVFRFTLLTSQLTLLSLSSNATLISPSRACSTTKVKRYHSSQLAYPALPISSYKLAAPLRSVLARHLSPKLAPQSRLSLISRHLDQRPLLELNTPFTTERQSSPADDLPYSPSRHFSTSASTAANQGKPSTMSNQAPHPALLIPGPIEFDDQVLQSMSHFRYRPRCCLLALPASPLLMPSQASHMLAHPLSRHSARR